MRGFAIASTIAFSLVASSSNAQVTPAELDKRMDYWKSKLPYCTYGSEKSLLLQFPAKDPEQDTDQCNDGDAVPLNGLVCTTVRGASGDFADKAEEACKAVKDSQGDNGRFWRSPKKLFEFVNKLPTSTETSSSNDSAQGAWAYIAEKRDVDAFRRWTQWMSDNKRLGVWPQYCLEESCAFNFGDCPMLDRIAIYLNEPNPLCNPHPSSLRPRRHGSSRP